MKKVLALLIALWLMVCTAGAETIDLSMMTDSEIITLLEQVNSEVVSRGIAKTAKLPQGTYIVGRDLPAGRYIYLSCNGG